MWDEPRAKVQTFATEQKLPYTILLDGSHVLEHSYGGGSPPQTFFLDRQGRIVEFEMGWGEGSEKEFALQIEALLAKRDDE